MNNSRSIKEISNSLLWLHSIAYVIFLVYIADWDGHSWIAMSLLVLLFVVLGLSPYWWISKQSYFYHWLTFTLMLLCLTLSWFIYIDALLIIHDPQSAIVLVVFPVWTWVVSLFIIGLQEK